MSTVRIAQNPAPPQSRAPDQVLPAQVRQGREVPFVLVHPANAWEFVEKPKKGKAAWGFLPRINQAHPRAGVGGVYEIQDGNGKVIGINDSAFRAALIAKGATIIDPVDNRLGPWKDCCKGYKCVDGGSAWVFDAGPLGRVQFEILPGGRCVEKADPAGWAALRAYIRDNSLCGPLSSYAVNQLLAIEEDELSRLERKAALVPALADDVKAKRARLDAIRTEWERIAASDGTNLAPTGEA